MTIRRVLSTVALAALITFGASSFRTVGACGGTSPGSCRDQAPIGVDLVVLWLDTGRMIVGLFG